MNRLKKSRKLLLYLIGFLWIATLAVASETEKDETFMLLYQGIPHDAFYDICFSGSYGIAVGVAGALLESHDAGSSWQSLVESFTSNALLGVSCDGKLPVVVGQSGEIFIKDGIAWGKSEAGTTERLLSVDMNNSGLAFAVGGFGTVLQSSDAGRSWKPVRFDWETMLNDFVEPHIYDVVVTDEGEVTLVGEFELILHSMDAGANWETVHKSESSLFALGFNEGGEGFAVGQKGKVLKTTDAGNTWQVLPVPIEANFLNVWSSARGEVVITGIRAMIRSEDHGQTWQIVRTGDVQVGWYQAIAVSEPEIRVDNQPTSLGKSGHKLIIAGHSGRILRVSF